MEELMEANSMSSSIGPSDTTIALVKHNNKTPKKQRPKVDKSEVTCFACGEKGHFRGNPDCKLFKPKEGSGELSLEKEFEKSSSSKKGK
jgi:hypothetical protein